MESSLSRGFQVKCLQYENSSEVRSCYKVKLGGAVLGRPEGLCQLCVSPKTACYKLLSRFKGWGVKSNELWLSHEGVWMAITGQLVITYICFSNLHPPLPPFPTFLILPLPHLASPPLHFSLSLFLQSLCFLAMAWYSKKALSPIFNIWKYEAIKLSSS